MSAILMLLLISTLIIAHELGHYFVARWCGVRVERFGFGLPMGPTLWSKKIGETEFCLHPVLFGGYVSFPDDSPDSTVPADSKERFENQPILNRAAIAVAGITVNALMGWGLMAGVLLGWGLPTMDVLIKHPIPVVQESTLQSPAEITQAQQALAQQPQNHTVLVLNDRVIRGTETFFQLLPEVFPTGNQPAPQISLYWPASGQDSTVHKIKLLPSPAAEAGIRGHEVVWAVNGEPVTGVFTQPISFVSQEIRRFPNKPVVLTLQNADTASMRNVTVLPNSDGLIGIRLDGWERTIPVHNPLVALDQSGRFLGALVVKNFQAFGQMFSGKMDLHQLAGPIKIVDTGAKLIETDGIKQGLVLTAIISVILAVMNLLPIPPLDGSHLLFLAIEALKGSPLNKDIQERIVQVGFMGLMALMIFVVWNDIHTTWIEPFLGR